MISADWPVLPPCLTFANDEHMNWLPDDLMPRLVATDLYKWSQVCKRTCGFVCAHVDSHTRVEVLGLVCQRVTMLGITFEYRDLSIEQLVEWTGQCDSHYDVEMRSAPRKRLRPIFALKMITPNHIYAWARSDYGWEFTLVSRG